MPNEQTKKAVQLHKKGDVNELLFANTKGELVELASGQTLEEKIPSLENKIEVIKIGDDALVIGSNRTVVIPAFYKVADADAKFATKDELSAIPKFGILVVESLPTTNIQNDKVYLVLTGEESENLYTEYVRVNNKWEKLGTQKIDISGKQDKLSEAQMAAANSGITAEKVTKYDGYESTINGKQEQLTSAQLAAANSGIDSTKVTKYDGYESTINGKQEQLTTAQLAAVNSGITSDKVATYDGYATGKQNALNATQLNAVNSGIDSTKVTKYDGYESTINAKADATDLQDLQDEVDGLDFCEYTVIKTLS